MSEQETFGDALTSPFWAAARRRELLIQQCEDCKVYQFYPRPFCVACESPSVAWVKTTGTGTVHSQTTVHLALSKFFEPPYVVALVELDEGPRLMSNIVGDETQIGDRVEVAWQDRGEEPPLPIFRKRN